MNSGNFDDDRLGIPDFMQNTSTRGYRGSRESERRHSSSSYQDARRSSYRSHRTYNNGGISEDDLRRARESSVGGRPIRATKKKKSLPAVIIRTLAKNWKGVVGLALGISLTLGAQGIGNSFHELDMLSQNPTYSAVVNVVNSHKSRTDNNQYWQIDDFGTATDIKTMVDSGADPLIVTAALGASLDESYAKDNLDYITNRVFGKDADTLVRDINPERYADGIHDKDFIQDARDYIVQQQEASNAKDEMGQMFEQYDSMQTQQNSVTKGVNK